MAQAEGEVILKKEKYVDAVVGPQSYHEICNIIEGVEKKNTLMFTIKFVPFTGARAPILSP